MFQLLHIVNWTAYMPMDFLSHYSSMATFELLCQYTNPYC